MFVTDDEAVPQDELLAGIQNVNLTSVSQLRYTTL